VDICKIAASTAGNDNLAARLCCMVQQQYALAALARHGSTHKASTTCAQNDGVMV
jgi:hypothetical protein